MKSGRLTPYLIILGLVLTVFWANFVSIEISAHAPGEVIPTGKVRVLQNLEGGIIKKIYVAELNNCILTKELVISDSRF